MKEILEYDGIIAIMCLCTYEFLGYNLTIVHLCEHMMCNIDAISRRFGPLVALHIRTAAIISSEDRSRRPTA